MTRGGKGVDCSCTRYRKIASQLREYRVDRLMMYIARKRYLDERHLLGFRKGYANAIRAYS